MALSIVTWNVQWATPRSRAPHLLDRIDRHAPEVICLTETHHDLLSQRGHSICSQPDYGYRITDRRKVLLWSREPWVKVDYAGNDGLPPGRFVSGSTRTSLGDVTVVGVCIPWFGSRTEARRGDRRKKPWEDHGRFLDGLPQVLERISDKRVIVMGDFNQKIGPGSRAPAKLRSALREAFPPGMRIVTSDIAFDGRSSIDHIALSADIAVDSMSSLSNLREGRKLSDHFGVAAHVSARGQAT
ncbi:MAG: endonuclease/exonuclease/phosphatase family protein [bacterium]|nr:endonuclease/exonuclease/phosphatase family protein [bacterium]